MCACLNTWNIWMTLWWTDVMQNVPSDGCRIRAVCKEICCCSKSMLSAFSFARLPLSQPVRLFGKLAIVLNGKNHWMLRKVRKPTVQLFDVRTNNRNPNLERTQSLIRTKLVMTFYNMKWSWNIRWCENWLLKNLLRNKTKILTSKTFTSISWRFLWVASSPISKPRPILLFFLGSSGNLYNAVPFFF